MPREIGALPPDDTSWQIGKTAASITFAREAEQYIAGCRNDEEVARLKRFVQTIKDGTMTFPDWLTVEIYLRLTALATKEELDPLAESELLPTGTEITFRFGNAKAARHFLDWLDGQGEQDYWEWMKVREREEPEGDITATEFNYHEPGNGVVIASCGRLDREDT